MKKYIMPKYESYVPLIGEDGLLELRKNLRFGDLVVNDWASLNNPHRVGVFIGYTEKGIKMTDMNGSGWETILDKNSKSKIIGNVVNPDFLGWQLPHTPG